MTENLVKITDFLLTLRHVQEISHSVGAAVRIPTLTSEKFEKSIFQIFLTLGQGGSSPDLPCRPWLRRPIRWKV